MRRGNLIQGRATDRLSERTPYPVNNYLIFSCPRCPQLPDFYSKPFFLDWALSCLSPFGAGF